MIACSDKLTSRFHSLARIPAPDVEAMVSGLIATRLGVPGVAPGREVLKAHIYKVAVQAEALEIALRPARKADNKDSGPSQPLEIVSLPWARKLTVAAKGVAYVPSNRSAADRKARDAALAAIGKARFIVTMPSIFGCFTRFPDFE